MFVSLEAKKVKKLSGCRVGHFQCVLRQKSLLLVSCFSCKNLTEKVFIARILQDSCMKYFFCQVLAKNAFSARMLTLARFVIFVKILHELYLFSTSDNIVLITDSVFPVMLLPKFNSNTSKQLRFIIAMLSLLLVPSKAAMQQ